ncbi:MAG TPA: DUF2716 domain-containing protein [Gemmataceae bacterium]|nr:DUF2716 domain-containing protein [Gemmataceae bacterium]
MNEETIRSVVDHMRTQRIAFEDGLSNEEVARVEGKFDLRFPPDLRRFLQTALPVSGGFPNWRSESEENLRRHFDRPLRGILFDIEHNDFWPKAWGKKPYKLDAAIEKTKVMLAQVSPLIPIRYGHYIPAFPAVDGNPIFAIRHSALTVASQDLESFLANGPIDSKDHEFSKEIPFWSILARNPFEVPNLAEPHSGTLDEYERLQRAIEKAGYWAEITPLFEKGSALSCHRQKPERYGLFWITKRTFGWLICVPCPRFYFAPQERRIADLCLALLAHLPEENQRLPFWNFKMDGCIQQNFGLVAFDHLTDFEDEREVNLRSLEQWGWREMSRGQEDACWDKYRRELECRSPEPSKTWDISPIFLRGKDHRDQLETDLTIKALTAFKTCTNKGEELLVLDWNHPCYFFDPHGGLSDASAKSWATPVLPDGDSYIYLASDLRFGIIGDCVLQTMCVFGRELLDAFAVNLPKLFKKTTWTIGERQKLETSWQNAGWQRLSSEEKDIVWEQFDERFGVFERRGKSDRPGMIEPHPSLTWDISAAYEVPDKSAMIEVQLTDFILNALRKATNPQEQLYALDSVRWYEHYRFSPHKITSTSRNSWALSVFPNDNYTVIIAADFRFGIFGNPLERSICLFGQELLDAINSKWPTFFGKLVRRNGDRIVEAQY